ncbi:MULTISPECIES: YraN family protein [Fusobacterium]|uniref:YraN family protein n=1 Tax=Fusobacterium TaxID=848 RepID=UPI001476B6A0|nr:MULTISPECIES: YraN family protein [Fusobacterium]NME35702.1 YraN family protein [Fusobacterium sp. FSA-380-WT-3A]
MKKFLNKRVQGEYFENLALNFLEKKGFQLVEKNFYSHFGEIDLILRKDNLIIFVEVKERSNQKFGNGFEAISKKKLRRMFLSANEFIAINKLQNFNIRFDAIAFDENGKCYWIENILWGDEIGF